MPVRVEKWDPAWGRLSEAALRRRLEGEGYSVNRYVYPPGTFFPELTHAVDKKDAVLSGRLKIGAAGREFVLEAGDSIDEFLKGFPTVKRDQVIAFLEEAKARMVATAS